MCEDHFDFVLPLIRISQVQTEAPSVGPGMKLANGNRTKIHSALPTTKFRGNAVDLEVLLVPAPPTRGS